MKKLVLGNITAVLLLAASAGRADQPLQRPQLSADYAKRRAQVLPNPREQSYRKIPLRTSVLHGIVDAQKSDKPVMIVLLKVGGKLRPS
jgi:hypothetical protein